METKFLIYIVLFFVGSIFGSFINAVAYRISNIIEKVYENENMNWKEFWEAEILLLKQSNNPKYSQCPSCNVVIPWKYKIPIFSYIFLRGKCFNCNTHISLQYFLIEVLTGILLVYTYYMTSLVYDNYQIIFFIGFLYIYLLFFTSMLIDIKTYYIPDFTFILSIPVLLFLSFFNYVYLNNMDFISWVCQFIIVPIIFYITLKYMILYIYTKYNKIFLGIADIKMLSVIMLYYGFLKTIVIYFLSTYIALPISLYFIYKKQNHMPYGIYIFISFILFEIYSPYIMSYVYKILEIFTV